MGKHLEVGFGANKTKRSGSQYDQGPHGAGRKDSSESHKGGNTGNSRVKARRDNGDHLTPKVSTRKTAEKGGHSREGHSNTKPITTKNEKFNATRVV